MIRASWIWFPKAVERWLFMIVTQRFGTKKPTTPSPSPNMGFCVMSVPKMAGTIVAMKTTATNSFAFKGTPAFASLSAIRAAIPLGVSTKPTFPRSFFRPCSSPRVSLTQSSSPSSEPLSCFSSSSSGGVYCLAIISDSTRYCSMRARTSSPGAEPKRENSRRVNNNAVKPATTIKISCTQSPAF
ncbi:MAG: hypothetical protein BWY66_02352 [bacterium ADurb.Bin374]|nr:MAG: hypothetical protein BWY66_02352 [bacterium ADurb.Bin374]